MSTLHPSIIITIDGQPISGAFLERLISVTITDKEGTRSDTIDLELEAGPPLLAIPRKKAIIAAWIEGQYFGAYTADDPTLHFLPYKLNIQGKSADMRDELKEHRSRHWDGQTFGGIVQQIAGEHGLVAQIDPEIAAFKGKDGYFAQEMESGLHFIERQARRLDGLFAIKDGKMIVAKKGKGATASGVEMPPLIIVPEMVIKSTGQVTWAEREDHKAVRAAYHNSDTGERKYEEAPASPNGKAKLTLRHQFSGPDEAKRAATARANELQRTAMQTSVDIIGNTGARGGAPMMYARIHPEVDGRPFIIETASHKFSKSGWTVGIHGKQKI